MIANMLILSLQSTGKCIKTELAGYLLLWHLCCDSNANSLDTMFRDK